MLKVLIKNKKDSTVIFHDDVSDSVMLVSMATYTSILRKSVSTEDCTFMFSTLFNLEELVYLDYNLESIACDVFESFSSSQVGYSIFEVGVRTKINELLYGVRCSRDSYVPTADEKFVIDTLIKANKRVGSLKSYKYNSNNFTRLDCIKFIDDLKQSFRQAVLHKSGIELYCDICDYYNLMDKEPSAEQMARWVNRNFDLTTSHIELLRKFRYNNIRHSGMNTSVDKLYDVIVEYYIPGLVPDNILIDYIRKDKEFYKEHAIGFVKSECKNKKVIKAVGSKLYVKQFQYLAHNNVLMVTVSVRGQKCQTSEL